MAEAMTLLKHNFKQKNDWTCGPAVARIVLHYFGKTRTIVELSRELKTNRSGTANKPLIKLLRRNGLRLRVKENASIKDLRRYLRRHLVMTAYWIPYHREGHYSIIKKVDSKRVYFHDPWFGSSHSYSLGYFIQNWWDGEARRWLLAVEKKRVR